jgi:Glucosidase II beta subunit-like protein/Glucosidase II beta subunit-like
MAPLPVSRVQDGICDCCDGSDETPVKLDCPDTCAKLVAAALAERTAVTERYKKGSAVRRAAMDAYQKYKTESLLELETLQTQLTTEQTNLEMSLVDFSSAKLVFAQQRLERMAASSANDDILTGLTTDIEWKQFIIHACQLAGEMSTEGTSCNALQLAALDAGLGLESTLTAAELANLLYHNANTNNNPDDRIWNVADLPKTSTRIKKKKKGRRLMRVVAADDYADDTDNDLYEDHFDEDHHDNSSTDTDAATENGDNDKSDERTAIEQLPFSESRVDFLVQASRLLKLIDEASTLRTEETKSDEELESLEPEELERRAKVKELVAMEDKAFDLLQATLTDRKRLIERGFDYALSAKHSLEEITDPVTLQRLVLGTVYHGKLSAIHVYQIMASILLFGWDDVDPQSCPNMVARMCPPKTIVRGTDTVPSKLVVDAVDSFCIRGADILGRPAVCVDADGVPTEISDGFAGYYEVFPRDEGDSWEKQLDAIFALTDEESARLVDLAEKEGSVEAARKKINKLEKTMKDLKGSIGTDDESKYGPDGELHSIRDECFSVKAGKYTYELCMYKQAAQKEGGDSTNLGNWAGAAVETIDDRPEHVWKWERGAKCWNGPTRSATAHVTCGSETVVLSADEPDTCRYVFQAQSPMACDEAFRTRHSLY